MQIEMYVTLVTLGCSVLHYTIVISNENVA